MDKKVWVFQYPAEVRKKGAAKASWYVGWYDLDNKRRAESCGAGARGKNKAEKRQRHIQGALDHGVYQNQNKKMWKEFRQEYEARILPNLAPRSRDQIKAALDHFERLCKPGRMENITTQTIDQFVSGRRLERGRNPKSVVSPATVNQGLRHLKAALRIALEWEYLLKMPKIRLVREPEKLVQYVIPEHFAKIYSEATVLAKIPQHPGQGFTPEQWWKALVTAAYMTGWRIRELLALRWEDVDLVAGKVITRHQDNKGKRDEHVPVHPVVIEQFRAIHNDGQHVFPWNYAERKLWVEFGRIQRAVGIHLVCRESHQHTDACHVYGFHDLRRSFATVNAKGLKPEVLQKMMRHRAYKTTLGYINLAEQIEEAVQGLGIPDVLQKHDDAKAVSPDVAKNTDDNAQS